MPSGYTFTHACSCAHIHTHTHTYRYTPVITHTDKHLDLVTGLGGRVEYCVRACMYKWGVWGILGCRLFSAGGCVDVHFNFFFSDFFEPLKKEAHLTKSQKLKR